MEFASSPSQLEVRPISYGPEGLWDMINFSLADFLFSYRLLVQEKDDALRRQRQTASGRDSDMRRNIEWATATLARICSDEMKSRLKVAVACFENGSTFGTVAYELEHVLRLLEEKIRVESFFHYEASRANLLRRVSDDWIQTIASFHISGVREEIEAGTDCFALGHFTASVFHMMRVAEIGLRALARERGVTLAKDKPIEYGNWEEILRELRKKIADVGAHRPAGEQKDRILEFYNHAVISLNALKDIYRNQTMHVRYLFNTLEAHRAMVLTNEFMERLGDEIHDDLEGEIDWDASLAREAGEPLSDD